MPLSPVESIRRGAFWGSWPTAWKRGLAGGLRTRGEKGLGAVVNNIATMQKRIEAGIKTRAVIADRVRKLEYDRARAAQPIAR